MKSVRTKEEYTQSLLKRAQADLGKPSKFSNKLFDSILELPHPLREHMVVEYLIKLARGSGGARNESSYQHAA